MPRAASLGAAEWRAFDRIAGSLPAPRALVAAAVLVGVSVNVPIVYVFVRALAAGPRRYLDIISSSGLDLLAGTLALTAAVVALSVVLALPLAWLVTSTDLPFRRFWAVAAALPLAFPSYVSAFALVAVFGPRGFLQGWLSPLGVERVPELAYGFTGALLALALFTYPYVYLLLVTTFRSLDPALEESARGLGAAPRRIFVRVVLPQLRGPLLAGGLLVALYTISDFGAVSIVRYNTLTLAIYTAYRSLFDRGVAAATATLLVLLALAVVAVQAYFVPRKHLVPAAPARPRRPVRLGRWRAPAILAMAALHVVTLGVPLGVILYWGARAMIVGNPLGSAWRAALHSTGVSLAAATIATIVALPIALWSARYASRAARFFERLTYSGFALPGLVTALAFVFLVSRHAAWLYQTLPLLVAAYVVRFMPETLSASRAAIAAVPRALEESARGLGRRPFTVARRITLPLVRPGLLAGAGLVFLTTMKELPATLILRPIGFETLATRVWSTAAEGIFSEAALPALLLLAVSAPTLYVLTIRPALGGRTE